jgi:hypothetical protein
MSVSYVEILDWAEVSRTQSNKPSRWKKLLAWLNIEPLPVPKYLITADIYVTMPHPLRVGDSILIYSDIFIVTARYQQNNAGTREVFRVSSLNSLETYQKQLGKVVIMGHTYSEFDKAQYPYTPEHAFKKS